MNALLTSDIWLLSGLLLGFVLRTFLPWLKLKPRPTFSLKFLFEPAIAAVLAIYPSLTWLPQAHAWPDALAGCAIAYFGQDLVRKLLTKPMENGG